MHTLEAIARRKSTRSYKPEQISEDTLQKILKAGFSAPVAMANYESLHITVVQDETALEKINLCAQEMMLKISGAKRDMRFGATTLLLVSSMPIHRTGMEYINAGIVVENMVLAATSLGIDSVILGAVPAALAQSEELVRELGIPVGYTPLVGAYLGYATEETPAKSHTIAVNRI